MTAHDIQPYDRTFVMAKPDAFYEGVVGEIQTRLEDAGLMKQASRVTVPSEELAHEHYDDAGLPEDLHDQVVEYLTSGPVEPMVWAGEDSIETVRALVGESFDPTECSPGTIRGDYGGEYGTAFADEYDVAVPNIVHAADEPAAAEREIDIWFDDEDLAMYEMLESQDAMVDELVTDRGYAREPQPSRY
ncbi:MAG: nucleoside-diphosphate kinase [Candidatus Nanohaloarchaeota archaeon QJJ-5]|nr:nucleoside-diphosphate kinase [Candidatus Nanohaloarchaeota archaeon QJJ-5]